MQKQISFIALTGLIVSFSFSSNPYFQQIFALPLSVLSTFEIFSPDIEVYLTYENRSHGVRIDFPSNWIAQQDISPDNVVAFRHPNPMEFGDNLFRTFQQSRFPNETSAGSIAAENRPFIALGIFIQNLSSILYRQNVSMENFSSLQLEYLQNKSFQISKLDNYTLSGYPAYMVEYSLRSQPTNSSLPAFGTPVLSVPPERPNMNVTQVWTVHDNKAYIIMASVSPPGLQDKTWPIIKRMINSFELIK